MDFTGDLLTFWFEGVNDQTLIRKKDNPFKKWFIVNRHFDLQVKNRFESIFNQAQLKDIVPVDRHDSLAAIILFDQISRNVYRNSQRAYAMDHKALSLSRQMVENKEDRKLMLIERLFVYLPLMHCEQLDIQHLSVELFQALVRQSQDVCPLNTKYYESHLKHAKSYLEIIKCFGRFPHRNHVLNRDSTNKETEYLSK